MLTGFSKMLVLSLCEIFKSVFHVINFIQSEIQVNVILVSSFLSSFLKGCDTVAFPVSES